MIVKSFHTRTQGDSHIKKNKNCQDYASSYQAEDNQMSFAIVCDGHGGDDYVRSEFGSRIACEVAGASILEFLDGVTKDQLMSPKDQRRVFFTLLSNIISKWNEGIYSHYSNNPFTEEELSVISEKARKKYLIDDRIEGAYGTTMIAVVMTQSFWFGFQIGDGKCVMVDKNGEFSQPIPWDDKCFLNATTSMCDSDAINNFRFFCSDEIPAAVFIGSDGVDDCFQKDEQLYGLYKTVLYSFVIMDIEAATDELQTYLPKLSAKGSGDDISIAGILNTDLIPQLDIVKKYDPNEEKRKLEEKARQEAEARERERLVAEKEALERENARLERERVRAEKERLRQEEQKKAEEERIQKENAKKEQLLNERENFIKQKSRELQKIEAEQREKAEKLRRLDNEQKMMSDQLKRDRYDLDKQRQQLNDEKLRTRINDNSDFNSSASEATQSGSLETMQPSQPARQEAVRTTPAYIDAPQPVPNIETTRPVLDSLKTPEKKKPMVVEYNNGEKILLEKKD